MLEFWKATDPEERPSIFVAAVVVVVLAGIFGRWPTVRAAEGGIILIPIVIVIIISNETTY